MKYDLFVITKYWRVHKKQAISILLTFVLLVCYIFVSLCMVRTELRRSYFDNQRSITGAQYSSSNCGGYNYVFYNLSEDAAASLPDEELVEKSSYYYTSGYMGKSNCKFTAGCFPNESALQMSGSRLIEGSLPNASGEIVLSELVLERLGLSTETGETLTLTSYDDAQTEFGSEREWKLVGILEDNGGKVTRETCSYASVAYFEPVILLSFDDCKNKNYMISQMICLTNGTKLSATVQEEIQNTSEDYISPYDEMLMRYLSECDGFSVGAYDSSYFTIVPNLNENYDGYLKSAKSNFYSYTAVAAGLLMAITLACCLFVILEEKIKSMRLLRRIGYSVARLRRMLLVEGLLFMFFGTLLGLLVAVGLYEILLQIQYHAFGLEIHRAYSAEWGIRQITYSPIAMSILVVGIVSLVSYAIPIIRMKSMLHNTSKKTNRSFISARSLNGCIRKIFHQPVIHTLQVVALTLVITVSCSALMFFSTNGKSSWQNPQILSQGKYFETDIGIDRRSYNIDCSIENQQNSFVAGLMATEVESGFSNQQIHSLENSALFTSCYGWTNLDNVFLAYPQGTDILPDLFYYDDSQFAPGEKDYYGLNEYDVYGIPGSLLVNNSMLNEIIAMYSDHLTNVSDISNDGVVILSLNGSTLFQSGDSLPLFTAYGTPDAEAPFGYDLKYAERFYVEVSDVIYMEDDDTLLHSILEKYSSDYLILFPPKTARDMTLPYQNFDNIYMKYAEGTSDSDVNSLIASVYTPESYMKATTATDCTTAYHQSMLKEYIIAFTVFGLMLLLSLIGYYQTLSLQIYQKSANIRNLRAIGMSKKSLCVAMYRQFIKVPVLSALLSVVAVYGMRGFLKWKYDKCTELYDLTLEQTDQSSEEFIALYTYFVEQQERFLTAYEMYKVPISGFLIALLIIVLVCISIFIFVLSKKMASKHIIEKMEEKNEYADNCKKSK